MRLLRNAIKNRRSQLTQPPPRRHSTAVTLELPIYQGVVEKIPAVTMLPRDSASSLPSAPSSPATVRPSSSTPPYYWKRPTLSELLADESPEPWTLAAFTEYCQQNLCLENLNFIIEAKEYRREYDEWLAQCTVPPSASNVEHGRRVIERWRNIVAEYTTPGGPQEVNLPGNVRHALTSMPESDLPTNPDVLKPAVRKIHELMQDSILLSFLNDVRPTNASEERLDFHDYGQYDDPSLKSRSIHIASPNSGSPPRGSGFSHVPHHNSIYHKQSATPASSSWHPTSNMSHRSGRRRSMVSVKDSANTSNYAPSIDDASSVTSNPAQEWTRSPQPQSPMSPIPSSGDGTRRTSSKSRSNSGWKRIGAKLGLKKSRSGTPTRDNEQAIVDD